MASSLSNAKSAFLENAACAYAQIDPATSAYLMTARKMGASIVDGQISCDACGTYFIPAITSSITTLDETHIKKSTSSKRARVKTKQIRKKSIQITCLRCHHYAKFPLPWSSPSYLNANAARTKSAAKAPTSEDPTGSGLVDATYKPSTGNTGSKKRAKVRRGGLQAILEKSKQNLVDSKGSDLDLMDFLKH